jgi:uncharacterized coiled-coil protein SlyX
MEEKDRELTTLLINSVETLSKRIEKLEEQLKKSVEMHNKNINVVQELNTTILSTNKVMDQVAQGITSLYEKIKAMEVWSKLIGNLGPLLGGLGGLGNAGGKK